MQRPSSEQPTRREGRRRGLTRSHGADAGSSACVSLRKQVCEKWNQVEPSGAGNRPCDPPLMTPVDFTVACEKTLEKCAVPAASIECP
ncbi:MAG: hypothetical protein U0263_08345 [Polyangiaceae bacterium]